MKRGFAGGCDSSYLKPPVNDLNDLYLRYPDGGHAGDMALVLRARDGAAGMAYWDGDRGRWMLLGEGALGVAPLSLEFDGAGGDLLLSINTVEKWNIMAASDWLSVDLTSGSGDGTITVTAGDNAGAARSAEISVSAGSITRVVEVTQACARYTLSLTSADSTTGSVNNKSGTYDFGTTVQIVATPAAHHGFVKWQRKVLGAWTDHSTSATFNLDLLKDEEIRAVFERVEFNVQVATSNAALGSVSGGGWVAKGSGVQISATAASGAQFSQWNDGNATTPRTISNVQADVTYTATFVSNALAVSPSTLSFAAQPAGSQDISVTANTPWTVEIEET